jgi:LysR family transcriptional regulator, glycine cleavage system transcriptional activator
MFETIRTLPLNALRAFAMVHALGGIRPAARELGVAHSSLSRMVSQLEAWAGVPLTRGGRGRGGLAFTPAGEQLGRAALAGLKEMERVALSLLEVRSPRTVVVSAAASFAGRWLLPRLPRLEALHPRLEVSVLVDSRRADLERGEVDLAIRMGKGPWKDADCEPLMDELLYPVMSPALWKQAGRPRDLSALRRLRLLHDRDPSTPWEVWRRAHGPSDLDVRRGPRFASSDLVLRAAAVGQGVALARHRLAADDVASGALVRPFEGQVELGPGYWLVFPVHGRTRPATATLVEWLKQEAAAAPPAPGRAP